MVALRISTFIHVLYILWCLQTQTLKIGMFKGIQLDIHLSTDPEAQGTGKLMCENST